MAVTVMGVAGRDMPGLKAAQKAFVRANAETADALLNVMDGEMGVKGPDGQKITENDPRPPYRHADFPKMLYSARPVSVVIGSKTLLPEEDHITVANADELDAALESGYQTNPVVKVRAAVYDPAIEKANLQRELREKDGQITTLAGQLSDMQAQIAEQAAQMKELLAAINKTNKSKAA